MGRKVAEKLTDTKVKKLISKGKRQLVRDSLSVGLYLQVAKPGSASWVVRYRRRSPDPQERKRTREMGLGSARVVDVEAAREQAAEIQKQLLLGRDPLAIRNKEKQSQIVQTAEHPFREVAAAFIETKRPGWKSAKHATQWTNTLEHYAYPAIGDLDVSALGVEDVLGILTPIWLDRNETARRVRGRVEQVLGYAITMGYRQGDNPARWQGLLETALPAPGLVAPVKHHKAMPYEKVGAFMVKAADYPGFGSAALRLAILCSSRTQEVSNAEWSEIDLEKGLWTIPAARMKAKRGHVIPLSSAAVELLESLPRIEGSPYVFPGRNPQVPINKDNLPRALKRLGESVTVHGFRSSFRTWALELGEFDRQIVELCMSHKAGDKTESTYIHGSALEKRRAVMQAWADYLSG